MAKSTKWIYLFVLIFIFHPMMAQNDSVLTVEDTRKLAAHDFIIPSVLISYGIVTRFSSGLQHFDKSIDNKISKEINRTFTFDDYIQYAPYLGIYGLDLCGIKAKHTILDRTLVLGTSVMICGGLTVATKHISAVRRPDGSNTHSFPSGHTATAFLGAHILHKEYKEHSPWIGVSAYAIATLTGGMRMINHKHWFSDVITGAGVGILSAELSYLLLPVWHKLFHIKSQKVGFLMVPAVAPESFGMNAVLLF